MWTVNERQLVVTTRILVRKQTYTTHTSIRVSLHKFISHLRAHFEIVRCMRSDCVLDKRWIHMRWVLMRACMYVCVCVLLLLLLLIDISIGLVLNMHCAQRKTVQRWEERAIGTHTSLFLESKNVYYRRVHRRTQRIVGKRSSECNIIHTLTYVYSSIVIEKQNEKRAPMRQKWSEKKRLARKTQHIM